MTPKLKSLTPKHQVFINEYLKCFVGAEAARRAGYDQRYARFTARNLMADPIIKAEIETRLAEMKMTADEALKIFTDQARANIGDFIDDQGNIDWAKVKSSGYIVKSISRSRYGDRLEIVDSQFALDKILRAHGRYSDGQWDGTKKDESPLTSISADMIGPSFVNIWRDLKNKLHTEYVLKGGRGSLKSSFVAEAFIYLLVNNPQVHGIALRHVADTLRDSVYARLQWAIGVLGLSDKFKCTVSPMEIVYLPTGQKIYFRGADDPGKIKSITPTFGYIGVVWLEEFDQFRGMNAIRTIEQSIRGGDTIYYFKSFNPPITKGHWVNKYLKIPKANQYQHFSNYLGLPEDYLLNEELRKIIPPDVMSKAYSHLAVPPEWLGKTWIEDAEHLKNVNWPAYEHEYLGIPVNDGGLVFPNTVLRTITDEEIAQFDKIDQGLDWGYSPHPLAFVKLYYDATREKIYIFDEYRGVKKSNKKAYHELVSEGHLDPLNLLIADSEDNKSIGDFRDYGANIRGAEKGDGSRDYSFKWFQWKTEIVIDPKRAPYTAAQFSEYEHEKDSNGDYISEYPKKNDDFIDAARYALNLIWRQRGK